MGTIRKLTGASQASTAARQGAESQERAALAGIAAQERAAAQARQDLLPFVQFSRGLMPRARSIFGEDAGEAILQDPVFQSLSGEAERRILASQAARGRLGTGETPILLQDAFLRTGSDLLSRERGDILAALGLGQASAAGVGNQALQTAGRTSDLLTQIGNVQASGMQGQALAQRQGFQDLLGLGAFGAGLFGLCDRRAKHNITPYGEFNGHKTYKFQYKHRDEWFVGPMADEVKTKNPDAVVNLFGYDHVNFEAL